MRYRMRLFLFLIITVSTLPLWANDCPQVDNAIREVLLKGKFLKEIESTNASTVQTGKAKRGLHGGKRFELLRRDTFEANREFLRGEPDWNIQLFGPDAAKFLGFEHVPPRLDKESALGRIAETMGLNGRDTFWTPDAAEVNGALDALDKAGVKTGLRFFEAEADDVGEVDRALYLKEFIQHGRLPLINQHDRSFHFAAVAIPEPWMQLKREQVQARMMWDEYSREHLSIYEGYNPSNGIDVFTGTVNLQLNPRLNDVALLTTHEPGNYGQTALQQLFGGVSPEDHITRSLSSAGQNTIRVIREFARQRRLVDPNFSRDLFSRDSTLPNLRDVPPEILAQAMNDAVKRRIKEISEKASQLLPKK